LKIRELQISNILSFKYYGNILEAEKINFEDNLNIFIGENGAGKSTALEVINFIFKRVLFTQFNVNQDLYTRRSTIAAPDRKGILSPANNNNLAGFRLEPNWSSEKQPQKIRLLIQLDEIDVANIQNLFSNKEKLFALASLYTNHSSQLETVGKNEYAIEITLNRTNGTFTTAISPTNDAGYAYLVNYNYYKHLIDFYNFENPQTPIAPLFESFTLIGGYRNYYAFNPSVSIQNSSAAQQIQEIRNQEFSKSLNSIEQSEPVIFNLVRLRVAGIHFELFGEGSDRIESEKKANDQPFLKNINKRLKLVNLQVKIEFTDKQKWAYSFHFYDIKRDRPLSDINSLSAGQKAIIHLVFEAYGRGDLKGGLVIIDEPEIHLHYQFQNEYLQVINEINKEQQCQYVLVTHSESLISSITIHNVKRFALDKDNFTAIKYPKLTTDQKTLVKILDNTRSTYAFFAKRVLLVEGEIDRYFFKALIQESKPELNQEIAVLDIIGKPNYKAWKDFFEAFGLTVYFVADLDAAFGLIYPSETAYKLHTPEIVAGFKCTHPQLLADIEQKRTERIYILKDGDLEHYLDIHNKGLTETIKFCTDNLKTFLENDSSEKSKEIKFIFNEITKND